MLAMWAIYHSIAIFREDVAFYMTMRRRHEDNNAPTYVRQNFVGEYCCNAQKYQNYKFDNLVKRHDWFECKENIDYMDSDDYVRLALIAFVFIVIVL